MRLCKYQGVDNFPAKFCREISAGFLTVTSYLNSGCHTSRATSYRDPDHYGVWKGASCLGRREKREPDSDG